MAYDIINGTDEALTDVNAGGDDVPARSVAQGIELTGTEMAALLDATPGNGAVAVMLTYNDGMAYRHAAIQLIREAAKDTYFDMPVPDLSTDAAREQVWLRRSQEEGAQLIRLLTDQVFGAR